MRLSALQRTGIAVFAGVVVGLLLRGPLGTGAILVALVVATAIDVALRRWEARE